jgi:hypothetical protein
MTSLKASDYGRCKVHLRGENETAKNANFGNGTLATTEKVMSNATPSTPYNITNVTISFGSCQGAKAHCPIGTKLVYHSDWCMYDCIPLPPIWDVTIDNKTFDCWTEYLGECKIRANQG